MMCEFEVAITEMITWYTAPEPVASGSVKVVPAAVSSKTTLLSWQIKPKRVRSSWVGTPLDYNQLPKDSEMNLE